MKKKNSIFIFHIWSNFSPSPKVEQDNRADQRPMRIRRTLQAPLHTVLRLTLSLLPWSLINSCSHKILWGKEKRGERSLNDWAFTQKSLFQFETEWFNQKRLSYLSSASLSTTTAPSLVPSSAETQLSLSVSWMHGDNEGSIHNKLKAQCPSESKLMIVS